MTHAHCYRAISGAGWRCIGCGRWTVARPPAEQTAAWQERQRAEWAIIAADELGVTVERTGSNPEALADEVASWAQQEEDKWPEMGLVYMLICPELVDAARALEEATA